MRITEVIAKQNQFIKDIFEHDRILEENNASNLNNKFGLQLIIAFSFLILSVANIIAKSYQMLIFTGLGFATNAVFAILALKLKIGKLSSNSSIITCSLLFATFGVNGGNDGFACLWVILFPLLAMVVMDFRMGLRASLLFQLFLIVVFWTPLDEKLFYRYNEQFCLRFPLLFFVTFMLGLWLAVTLRQAEYNEHRHMIELEKMNQKALMLSRIDPLTKLANRRYTYEEQNRNFVGVGAPHSVVMGDIDDFKKVNDLYGHEFGDEVLVTVSKYITEVLPESYLKSRWGGEEFLITANESLDVVNEQVETLRSTISEHRFVFGSTAVHVTMTFGIASYADRTDIAAAMNLADKRLYIGKNNNKNCVVTQSKDE